MKCCLPTVKIKSNPDDNLGERLPFIVIGPGSPLSYRKAVRRLAEDFANLTEFSPAPYDINEVEAYGISYWRDRVLLFSDLIDSERMRCFGAVGIRWRKYDGIPEGWIMTWAWFHPSERRKGHLSNAWSNILKLFPNLKPLPPLTPAMESFLKKFAFPIKSI